MAMRNASGQFVKGVSGNARGRPIGAKGKRTLVIEALERHSTLEGKAAQVDSLIALICKSDDDNTVESAANMLIEIVRGEKKNERNRT